MRILLFLAILLISSLIGVALMPIFSDKGSIGLTLAQGIGSIMMFVVPPIVYFCLTRKEKPMMQLGWRKASYPILLVGVAVMFISLPVTNQLTQWNEEMHFGKALAGLEHLLKSMEEAAAETDTAQTQDLTYRDDNISITLTEYREYDTTIYVADVRLADSSCLKTALANNAYGKNVTEYTSSIAERVGAVLAINGDYYGAQEKGIVIRNGIVYRDTGSTSDVLCIYADGSMKVISPEDADAQKLVSQGVWQAFSFGPGLVEDGTVTVMQGQEVGKAMASNPRTAIGIIDQNHYLFVVSDGRTSESEGLSLYELAQFMQKLGVTTAYNLDGGGSSTMYFNGQVINNPTTNGNIKERKVSDIVYIG